MTHNPALTHQQLSIVNEAANVVGETNRLRFYGDVIGELLTTLNPGDDEVADAVNVALRHARDEARLPP